MYHSRKIARRITAPILIGLVLLSGLMPRPALAEAASGATVRELGLTTAGGQPFAAYVAGPEGAPLAILVAHDWFGISDFTLETIDILGAAGYRAMAVDLYGGESARTHKQAFALMQGVDKADGLAKLEAGLEAVSRNGRPVVAFGFSMGSGYVLEFASRHADEIEALVIWYGDTPGDGEQMKRLEGLEILAVYGSLDGDAAGRAAALSKAADGLGAKAHIFIYPQAHHAFAQPLFNAGRTYDGRGAKAAWAVTMNFLEGLAARE